MDPLTRLLMQGAAGAAGGDVLGVEDVFSTWLYTGQGTATVMTVDNGIDLTGEGGMVWLKARSTAFPHEVTDTVRGTRKAIRSDSTAAQVTNGDLGEFTSSGFKVGGPGSGGFQVGIGDTYASWTFRKAPKFFDVVTWTGNDTDGRQIAHNLGSAPGCVIIKRTDSAIGWAVYHRSRTTTYGELNSTNAFATSQLGGYNMQEVFGNSSAVILPDASNITVARFSPTNASGGTYVAYLFAHDAGGFGDSGDESVIKCGTVNIGGSGTFDVNLGWEPQWVLFKYAGGGAGSTPNWYMSDNMRGFNMSAFTYLWSNTSAAEVTLSGEGRFVPYATGFKSTSSSFNAGDYIYIAIRRGPMKTPTDATKVFAVSSPATGTYTTTTNFPIDSAIVKSRSTVADWYMMSRITGNSKYLNTTSTAAESTTAGAFNIDSNVTFTQNLVVTNPLNYIFRRAPGFFDVVAYTGTGSTLNVNHNLGVAPELIITKNRSSGVTNWAAYSAALGNTQGLYPNAPNATSTLGWWNNTSPTSTVFTVTGTDISVNQSGSGHIAYLFATCPGVIKVGSYTGTGTTLNIDCGFAAGARFVLIKRTDDVGDWYVWDTARGIVSGNDPYLLINSTAAEVTSTDYIDPLASGFQITSTAPAAINASGGSFIFLAVA